MTAGCVHEDRVSFLLDDGSIRGFEEFGGWLTVHGGMRSLPDAAAESTVVEHPHFGEAGLGRTDIRKYIPQACAGEWWENDWREIRPSEELAALKADGVFVDLPMWRAHRSDPLGYGTDHHVLDYRHSDAGRNTYTDQAWDPDDGPTYMWDPDVVANGALDFAAIRAGDFPTQGLDTYALELAEAVPFDRSIAAWDGAMIPRRPLQPPYGSAADWTARGTWRDGRWTVYMERKLRTNHPADTTQLEPGGEYTWTPAVHHGAGQRWHWVAYPYKLGLGVRPDYVGAGATDATTELVATEFAGGAPDWDGIEPYTIPLIFPGVVSWDDLAYKHPRAEAVRACEVTMWDLYEKDPASFLP